MISNSGRRSAMPNPYKPGGMVTDPEVFFGRREELRTLRTRLAQRQSTSVVGMRRIGKSSLLYHLVQQPELPTDRRCALVSLDLQDARCHTAAGFLGHALNWLNAQCGSAYDFSRVTSLTGFADAVDHFAADGVHPVLCLDEFEEFTRRTDQFNDDFFETLRSLAQAGKLAFVTASQRPLEDLTHEGNLTSPFYNIFIQVDLGLLEPEAAEELARVPFERTGIMTTSADRALALELGGRHPFYLQMSCGCLYDEMERATPPDRGRVRRRFARGAESHFRGLWRHLTAEEQAALKHLVGLPVVAPQPAVLKRLERAGVVELVEEEYRVFSQAFAEQVSVLKSAPLSSGRAGATGRSAQVPIRPATSWAVAFGLGVATFVIVLAAVSLVAYMLPDQFADIMGWVRWVFAAVAGLALTLLGYVKGPQFLDWLGKMRGR
jgi:hypothetical protein